MGTPSGGSIGWFRNSVGCAAVVLMPRSGEEEAYHWSPLLCGIGALLTHTAGDLGQDFEVVYETNQLRPM